MRVRWRPGIVATVSALVLARPALVAGQLEITGQVDIVAAAQRDSLGLNSAFRGDNPFNPVRLKIFARHWVNDRIGIFTELLFDVDAAPRVNGAYVVVNDLAGRPWLSARVGLAPSPMGGFGLRSTYFNANPTVGLPLLWQYRTNVAGDGTSTVASLTGSTGEPGGGVPILYDACWNVQWELMGEVGDLEYSIALTPGSVSNPIKARFVDGSQWLGRVGYGLIPGLRIGFSGAHGPYLTHPEPDGAGNLPYTQDPGDYDETLLGGDLEYGQGPLLVYAELFAARFETPLVAERLAATGGYLEVRFDFLPGWYAAARAGGLFFGDIVTDPQSGSTAPWDDDTRRTELALGRRMSREVLVKLDWQRTTTRDAGFVQNLLVAQLSAAF